MLTTPSTVSWLHGSTLAPVQGWASLALGERRAMSPDQERGERKWGEAGHPAHSMPMSARYPKLPAAKQDEAVTHPTRWHTGE